MFCLKLQYRKKSGRIYDNGRHPPYQNGIVAGVGKTLLILRLQDCKHFSPNAKNPHISVRLSVIPLGFEPSQEISV